ncbi:hypothetical protein B0H16DRAFT_1564768, partial [Mycena metata]
MAVMTVYARDHEPCMFPHSRVSSPCPLGDSFRDACAARTGVLFFTSFPRRWLRASPLLHFFILHVIWSRRGRVLSTDPYSTPSEIGVDTRGGGMSCTTYEVGCTCAHRALAFPPPSPFVRWAVSASGKCALAPCVEWAHHSVLNPLYIQLAGLGCGAAFLRRRALRAESISLFIPVLRCLVSLFALFSRFPNRDKLTD